jgi:hypothetical protein
VPAAGDAALNRYRLIRTVSAAILLVAALDAQTQGQQAVNHVKRVLDRIIAAVVLVHGSGPNDRDETIGPQQTVP